MYSELREAEEQESESSKSQGQAASIHKSNLHGCWAVSFSDWINPQIFGASQSPFQSDKPWSTGQQNVRRGEIKTKGRKNKRVDVDTFVATRKN